MLFTESIVENAQIPFIANVYIAPSKKNNRIDECKCN